MAPKDLRPLLPRGLELDLYEGRAWIGVVPFLMSGVRHRLLPPLYGTSRFPELNVRTYVRHGGHIGVWFFSLDAMSRLAVWGARQWFHLPYYYARMRCEWDGERVHYESRRAATPARSSTTNKGSTGRVNSRGWVKPRGVARFSATYGPTGPSFEARPGSFEHYLTARYCLFSCDRRGLIRRGMIDHLPWPLQTGTVEIHENSMLDVLGLTTPPESPHVLYVQEIRTVAWSLRAVAAREHVAPVAQPNPCLNSAEP